MSTQDYIALGQLIVSGLGLLIVALSIYLLYRQTQESVRQSKISTEATRASIYQATMSQMIDINKVFIERPQLRKYFYMNCGIEPDQDEYDEVLAVAETFIDLMDMINALRDIMPEHLPWESWRHYIDDLFRFSPILREFWKDNSKWFPTSLHQLISSLPYWKAGADTRPQASAELSPAEPPNKSFEPTAS